MTMKTLENENELLKTDNEKLQDRVEKAIGTLDGQSTEINTLERKKL